MKKLTSKEINKIPRSFDVIGDILIFSNIPDELIKKKKEVGNYMISKLKNIKVVAKKIGIHKGKFRTRKIKIIAGEKRKETIYKENNARLKLDVEKCYFSPRLSNERLRIARSIKKNETVLVMFSGISVYPLVISKNSKAKLIYGIEINKIAHKYGEENLILNKAKNVKLILGDVKKIVPKLKIKFDRILMPLPKEAYKYLDLVDLKLKKGGILHYYDFLKEEEIPQKGLERLKNGLVSFKLLKYIKCGHLGPGKFRVCFDVKIM
ncbi:class I SAM-dependent methyltransferase family protein [Candidatus Woesearchaeota archaeon]|nr:class I SAM-dependent methyltransferase family protein [Candidatus Woesearchaeota archaeon]